MMLENNSPNKTIIIIRWITFLPLAILGSWLAYILVYYWGNMLLGFSYFNLLPYFGQYYLNSGPNIVFGVTFVYIGAIIAPYHQKIIALLLGCIGLVLSGFSLFPYMISNSGWQIWGVICTIIGICAALLLVYKGKLDLN